MTETTKANKMKGVLYAVLASAAFGLMPILAKTAYNNGATNITVISLRFVIASILLFIYLKITKADIRINKEEIKTFSIIGVFGHASTALSLFFSYSYISSGLATTLHFIYPVLVILANVLIFKEGLTKNKLISLILAIIGIYLLIGIKTDNLNIIGVVLALVSGFTYAFCVLAIKNSCAKDFDSIISVFYFISFAGIFTFIIGLVSGQLSFNFNITALFSIISVAIISTVISTILFVKALKIIGSSSTSILGTLEPLVGIVLGIILFGEKVTLLSSLGIILVLTSSVIVAFDERG